MRKKLNVLFCCIIVVLAVFSCTVKTANTARAELDVAQVSNLKSKFESRGIYNFDELEIFVYRFDNADICVYEANDYIYLVEKDDGETAYSELLYSGSQFVGLSDKYILFLTPEGLLAYELPYEVFPFHNPVHAFDSLSDEEQAAFLSPVSYEKYE